ncbi:DUF3341 domain-containing protein [Fontivita pretiosa]|uniref:DUF3341 domain-containing protein n=1 Tax=Fontivita pretiosa TaxID=2989684 RepID=UPI003D185302
MSVETQEQVVREQPAQPPRDFVLAGMLAEFADVDSVMQAARYLRDAGFDRWDVHTPFPVHGMDEAMGIRPTILPWLVLGGGLTGVVGGLALQWFTNAFDYPFFISGKPLLSVPAWVPVTFELGVLLAALTAVFGMLGLNRLPHLYNPLFRSRRFRRVTNDRFFVVIDASDPNFDRDQTEQMLLNLGATAVEWIEE